MNDRPPPRPSAISHESGKPATGRPNTRRTIGVVFLSCSLWIAGTAGLAMAVPLENPGEREITGVPHRDATEELHGTGYFEQWYTPPKTDSSELDYQSLSLEDRHDPDSDQTGPSVPELPDSAANETDPIQENPEAFADAPPSVADAVDVSAISPSPFSELIEPPSAAVPIPAGEFTVPVEELTDEFVPVAASPEDVDIGMSLTKALGFFLPWVIVIIFGISASRGGE